MNKYEYEIQGYHPPYGWEMETTEETFPEAKEQLKCYQDNVNYPLRIKRVKRELENNGIEN